MGLDKKLFKMLNEQMNQEIISAAHYANMAALAAKWAMNGFSKFLFIQSQEELIHFQAIYNFLLDLNEIPVVTLAKIEQIQATSVTQLPNIALNLEIEVTKNIDKIVDYAWNIKNFNVVNYLQKFIEEQREEISLFTQLIDDFKLATPHGLYELNKKLGERAAATF